MTTRTKLGLTIALLGLMGLILGVTAGGQEKNPGEKYKALLGTWDAQTENASRTFVFEFFLKDGVLKGKYTGAAGSAEMEALTFENNIVRFSVTVSGMELEYSAIIDGDKLTGQVTLQYGQADITGEKRKK